MEEIQIKIFFTSQENFTSQEHFYGINYVQHNSIDGICVWIWSVRYLK